MPSPPRSVRLSCPSHATHVERVFAVVAGTLGEVRKRCPAFYGKIEDWKAGPMAHRTTLEAERGAKPAKSSKKAANGADRERTFEAFRRWGYLQANLDPLGFLKPLDSPDLDFGGEIADEARQHYCGSIGADFMHLAQPERRDWIAERMEAEPETVDQQKILE